MMGIGVTICWPYPFVAGKFLEELFIIDPHVFLNHLGSTENGLLFQTWCIFCNYFYIIWNQMASKQTLIMAYSRSLFLQIMQIRLKIIQLIMLTLTKI